MAVVDLLQTDSSMHWQGLAEHKDELGAPLCPCRHYDDKQMEAQQGFWNCPCVPMRERKVPLHTSCVFRCLCAGMPAADRGVSIISGVSWQAGLLDRCASASACEHFRNLILACRSAIACYFSQTTTASGETAQASPWKK